MGDAAEERKLRSSVYRAAVKRLIAAHLDEWEQLRAEEWERLRPGQPSRQRSSLVELPMEQITKEYVAGASLLDLAKKYDVGKETLRGKIPPELLRDPGRPKRSLPRGSRRFLET